MLTSADAQYYYITDISGNVIAITNENREFVAEYYYDEWGRVLITEASGTENRRVANLNPIRYRGYYYDTETGYYYLRSRYYNPEICRFINADAPEIAQLSKNYPVGINNFAYCNNNPVCNTDSSGMWVELEFPIYPFKNGFGVYVNIKFLNKDSCLSFAKEIVRYRGSKNKYKEMKPKRIAIEIWAHAFMYYFSPYIRQKRIKNWLVQKTKYIEVNNDDWRYPAYLFLWINFKVYVKQVKTNPKAGAKVKNLVRKVK